MRRAGFAVGPVATNQLMRFTAPRTNGCTASVVRRVSLTWEKRDVIRGAVRVLASEGEPINNYLRTRLPLAETRVLVVTGASLPEKIRVCVAAREVNPRIKIVAVAAGSGERAWLQEVGAVSVYDAFDEAAESLIRVIESNI